jgi:glutathione S-transferase
MSLILYSHPFSSYCQKVLIALYEKGLEFEYRRLEDAEAFEELRGLWPFGKFPVLVREGRTFAETSVIIEHLDSLAGPALVPQDREEALRVRFLDRVFDNHVMTPMQLPVSEALRPDGGRKQEALAEAARRLDTAYAWLERELDGREWAAGERFTLADCAAAPSLFYADWVHPIGEAFPTLRAYRARLLGRPSFRRCVEEARPYRPLFPLGAPDRD